MQVVIVPFFDPATSTVTYVVHGEGRPECAIIDSVLDYDPKSARTSTRSADKLIAFVHAHGLHVQWILETHAHADHLSAAAYLKRELGGRVAIGHEICRVQKTFKQIFNLNPAFPADGTPFDHLFDDGERFNIGELVATAIHVPGHTPADMAYAIGDVVFVGDTLFMPDVGTARCDFPGGDAHELYRSIRRLLEMPDDTRLFMCHDYPPSGRTAAWETTVRAEREWNIHVRDGLSEDAFVSMRTQRDATLELPTLILPSVQINIRAGQFPLPESNGVHYLKLPLNTA